ncbi:MAG TPA: sodium/solute symporter [bacterium]|nr:sodium/solute symporter [bacterium]HQP98202.1 sodium/solute symporter [bacterium]
MKLCIVAIYILVMILIGYFGMRKTKNVGDFFLGGRTIGPWLSAFAYGATYFSAVLFIGYAGKLGWGFGLHTMWIVLGNALVGVCLAWYVLAGRTRSMTTRLDAMTMPEFLAARYDSPTFLVGAALIIFVFLVPYSASVYMGLSYLFEVNLGIPYEYALLFMGILTGIYLIMGGYFALTLTDLIQGLVMLFGVFVMVGVLVSQTGGFVQTTRDLMRPEFAPGLLAKTAIPGWVTLWSLVIITSFGPWGLPQMVQKFYSIKSESIIPRVMLVCTVVAFIMAFGAYYTGSLTHLFYEKPPEKIDELIPRLLTDHAPASIAIVILLLVVSASMSSLSSLVLVSSSAVAIDLYSRWLNPNAPKNRVFILMRIFCGIFIALSLYIALKQPAVIVNLMVISWGALAGSFIAPYLYGLYWRRTTRIGAMTGMFSGVVISVALFFKLGMPGIPLAGAISMAAPLVIVPVVSWLTRPFPEEHLKKVFGE